MVYGIYIWSYTRITFRPLAGDSPTLYQLQKFKGQQGRTVKVIEKVSPVWESLAIALHFNSAVIETLKRNNHDKCDLACIDMFGRWLEGRVCKPVTWETLMAALQHSEKRSLNKLARVLDSSLL